MLDYRDTYWLELGRVDSGVLVIWVYQNSFVHMDADHLGHYSNRCYLPVTAQRGKASCTSEGR